MPKRCLGDYISSLEDSAEVPKIKLKKKLKNSRKKLKTQQKKSKLKEKTQNSRKNSKLKEKTQNSRKKLKNSRKKLKVSANPFGRVAKNRSNF